MNFTDYLVFVANKLKDAENKGDKDEWIRLANVLVDTTKDSIRKLEAEG